MVSRENESRRRLALPDVALWVCAAVALILLTSADASEGSAADRDLDGWAFIVLGVSVVMLWWRHRFPTLVVAALFALQFIWHWVGYRSGLINAPTLVALYTLGTFGIGRRQLAMLGAFVVILIGAIVFAAEQSWSEAVDAVGWTVVPVLFGEVVRSRRALLGEYAERAARAEADRDAMVERRVGEERLRIARELHDVLAHTVSTMTVQAVAGLDALDRRPDVTRGALVAIRSSAREATQEIRATLTVLRDPRGVPDRAPAPSLAQLDDAVARASGAGIVVDLDVVGDRRPLTPLIELTAYRVAQEALTNVVRHARASHATVRLTYLFDELAVDVVDDGTRAPELARPGLGLRGMSERVESCGGRLTYGPLPAGGFGVHAVLPLGETANGR